MAMRQMDVIQPDPLPNMLTEREIAVADEVNVNRELERIADIRDHIGRLTDSRKTLLPYKETNGSQINEINAEIEVLEIKVQNLQPYHAALAKRYWQLHPNER